MNKYDVEVYNNENIIIFNSIMEVDKNLEEMAQMLQEMLEGKGWAYIQPM